jgi:hypothetical protein
MSRRVSAGPLKVKTRLRRVVAASSPSSDLAGDHAAEVWLEAALL